MTYIKAIYFPAGHEAGMNKGYPEIIYINAVYGLSQTPTVHANRDPKELDDGRSSTYPMRRCIPYSDELWYLCQQHIKRRLQAEVEYDKLVKMAAKKNIVVETA